MSHTGTTGSGTQAVDEYRYNKGLEAAAAFGHGRSALCRAADHAGGELCVETVARLASSDAKSGASTLEQGYLAAAIHALRAGLGTHAVAGTHSGGNTCAQVIAAQTR